MEARTNRYLRKYRRSSRLYSWLFAVAAALLVAQTMERATDKKSYEASLAIREAALLSTGFALSIENERAVRLEKLLDQCIVTSTP